jgi:hypothetical protein
MCAHEWLAVIASGSRSRRQQSAHGRGTWSRQGVISGGWPWWAAAAASEQSIGVAVIKVRNESAQRHCVLDDALANDIQRASASGAALAGPRPLAAYGTPSSARRSVPSMPRALS